VFNLVILALWTTRFGNIYAGTSGGGLRLGEVLAGPESSVGALSVGDPAVLDAAAPADVAEMVERAARIERHVSEERLKKKSKRANTLLLVHAARAEAAQAHVEQHLEELAARWKLAEVTPTERGFLLTYLARLDGPAVQGAVMDRLRNGPGAVIEAAELRSLKGINPRA
jgi:ribosomal protein S15P/S13E